MKLIRLPQNVNGVEFYSGPSLIDGKPIVGIATLKTANRKTGNLIQTWILRSDDTPLSIIANGEDESICGNCVHRGNNDGTGRSCYVNVYTAPSNIYKTWLRGKYPKEPTLSFARNKLIRLGAYGDPASIPYEIWAKITEKSIGWTGYTHQWKTIDPIYSNLLMASVDSRDEALEAKAKGYRTFRVRHDPAELFAREFDCPASEESGKRLTCEECLACCGTHNAERCSAGDISITVHGRLKGNFK